MFRTVIYVDGAKVDAFKDDEHGSKFENEIRIAQTDRGFIYGFGERIEIRLEFGCYVDGEWLLSSLVNKFCKNF